MRNMKGWKTVFVFTLQQNLKKKSFQFVTALISVLILAACLVFILMDAKPDDSEDMKPSPIEKVYVLDQSGLQPIQFGEVNPAFSTVEFKHIEFVDMSAETAVDGISHTSDETASDAYLAQMVQKAAVETSQTIVITIEANTAKSEDSGPDDTLAEGESGGSNDAVKPDGGNSEEADYLIQAIIPDGSSIKEKDVKTLLDAVTGSFETNKLLQSGLSMEQLTYLMKPVTITSAEVGESTHFAATLIKMLTPMIFGLLLYMMLLLYGQQISQAVSTEKTSKLMDTLLVSVNPVALIMGKVLAITSMAVFQFVIWIGTAFAGLFGGNALAHALYPDYHNVVVMILRFIREHVNEAALTFPSILLAVAVFGVGFLFYAMIAALAGCMVLKPEDVSTTQAVTQLPVITSWLICYFGTMIWGADSLAFARYIPFTAPFCVPVDLITGGMSIMEGLLSIGILSVVTLLLTLLSAKIYKGLVLFNGQKISLKTIKNMLMCFETIETKKGA